MTFHKMLSAVRIWVIRKKQKNDNVCDEIFWRVSLARKTFGKLSGVFKYQISNFLKSKAQPVRSHRVGIRSRNLKPRIKFCPGVKGLTNEVILDIKLIDHNRNTGSGNKPDLSMLWSVPHNLNGTGRDDRAADGPENWWIADLGWGKEKPNETN